MRGISSSSGNHNHNNSSNNSNMAVDLSLSVAAPANCSSSSGSSSSSKSAVAAAAMTSMSTSAVGFCRLDSSKYSSSKRDYERDRSSNYRDRDLSPGGSGGGGGGGTGGGGGGRGGSNERYSFIQKMRDRDRDVYKKDKYSDKRDRRGNDRDSESYRTNHDRDRRGGGSGASGKLCSSRENDKRSGSDDRDRERDRDLRDIRDKRDRGSDRDRDMYKKDKYADKRDRSDRGERTARYGDWSEHVSSSGKMYYYNCKTEISQWEKPKEWVDRERNLPRDQHREKDYRDKERDRDRDDRFSRSTYKHSNSSRDNTRLRWSYNDDVGPPSHRRRLDGRHNENADMDISGDSTPTSEASYSLSGTPTTHGGTGMSGGGGGGGGGGSGGGGNSSNATMDQPMGNALPRLASHPNTGSSSGAGGAPMGGSAAAAAALHYSGSGSGAGPVSGATMLPTSGLSSVPPSIANSSSSSNSSSLRNSVVGHIGSTSSTTVPTLSNQDPHQQQHQHQHHLNSNAPLPPGSGSKGRQKMHLGMSVHDHGQHNSSVNASGSDALVSHAYNSVSNSVSGNSLNSLRDNNSINSPLYMSHPHHNLSPPLNYTKSPIPTIVGITNTGTVVNAASIIGNSYTCQATYGPIKTVVDGGVSPATPGGGGNGSSQNIVPGLGAVSGISVITSMGSNSVAGVMSLGDGGPPTPTMELDLSSALEQQQQQQQVAMAATMAAAALAVAQASVQQQQQAAQQAQQQRKLDGASGALSSLQSCVGSSVQAANLRGPEISPKLAKYFRADLIAHVTNWQAEILERQVSFEAQKCCEDTHLFGDITCTRICAELKCARSLVRSTEINATLQEQKIMYLRQQIRRIEESKTQNAFMSDDT
ncbi:WW domain-containing adapter protein with coiled-coil homolog isoform X5 [Drosophila subobscura]|uniref:WW domain-containing adapter protein with coiled-coil homolog isoform X5 n=1 Tax=Drosophila subobscura TaxID=7241 RepID=UPI00155AFB65|nr:WW domain-containing adapter protein with coiled-coil homolog isoform X5 [Drosophila subobscura]